MNFCSDSKRESVYDLSDMFIFVSQEEVASCL